MSKYITETDELLAEEGDEFQFADKNELETAVAYEVTYDDDFDGIKVESKTDDFVGLLQHIDVDNEDQLIEHQNEIYDGIIDLRKFQNSTGKLIDLEREVISVGDNLPTTRMYVIDNQTPAYDGVCFGVRVSTEVDGDQYGFETYITEDAHEDDINDMFDRGLMRHFRSLREKLWDDFVVDQVTLEE